MICIRWFLFSSRSSLTGVVPRTFGIAPEKALKMQAWVLVGRWVDRHVDNPTITKWLMAGAAAGAATTLIGELAVFTVGVCMPLSSCLRMHSCHFYAVGYLRLTDFFLAFSPLFTHHHTLGSSILSLARREDSKTAQSLYTHYAD